MNQVGRSTGIRVERYQGLPRSSNYAGRYKKGALIGVCGLQFHDSNEV